MLEVVSAQTPQVSKQNSLIERARKGDDSALAEMEKNGDVQDLESLLHDPEYARKGFARFFLARLGDQEALQYYACRSLTADVSSIPDLMRQEVDLIGGDFTIQVYRHLLDSDPIFRPEIERFMEDMREHGGDTWPILPSALAMFKLSKLLPNSSVPKLRQWELMRPGVDEEFKSKWRNWIDSHADELQKSKPIAVGIKFDQEYCSKLNTTSNR